MSRTTAATAAPIRELKDLTRIIQRASGIRRKSFANQNAMLSSHGTRAKPRGMTPMIVRGSPST